MKTVVNANKIATVKVVNSATDIELLQKSIMAELEIRLRFKMIKECHPN